MSLWGRVVFLLAYFFCLIICNLFCCFVHAGPLRHFPNHPSPPYCCFCCGLVRSIFHNHICSRHFQYMTFFQRHLDHHYLKHLPVCPHRLPQNRFLSCPSFAFSSIAALQHLWGKNRSGHLHLEFFTVAHDMKTPSEAPPFLSIHVLNSCLILLLFHPVPACSYSDSRVSFSPLLHNMHSKHLELILILALSATCHNVGWIPCHLLIFFRGNGPAAFVRNYCFIFFPKAFHFKSFSGIFSCMGGGCPILNFALSKNVSHQPISQ